ncbi:MAG: hypothetical protein HYS08_04440 [Chlamydiae bacterium]|nr:hypothetical protein [Chlamydiota bacterium]MBI3265860.1 hypothetical protein [Chlamydiota bacterium]
MNFLRKILEIVLLIILTQITSAFPESQNENTVPKEPSQNSNISMTGAEVYEFAYAEAIKWKPDAALSEISTFSPLDTSGKSAGWTLNFWSPSTKGWNSIMFMNGKISNSVAQLPVPQAVIISHNAILDTYKLYNIAEREGLANKSTTQGYRPIASLIPSPVDNTRLTWYFSYMGGDGRVVHTVIIDAITGQMMQAID